MSSSCQRRAIIRLLAPNFQNYIVRTLTKKTRNSTTDLPINSEVDLLDDSETQIDRWEDLFPKRVKYLSDVLGRQESLIENKIHNCPALNKQHPIKLKKTAETLKVHYSVAEIMKYPSVLAIPWRVIEYRRRILKEIGATNANNMCAILLFNTLYKMSIYELKEKGVIDWYNDIERFVNQIENCPPGLLSRLFNIMGVNSTATMSLEGYRSIIIDEYLKATLKPYSLQAFGSLVDVHLHSLDLLSQRMNILMNVLKFRPDFIVSNPFLIRVNTQNLKEIVDTIDTLCSVKLAYLARKYPQLLAVKVEDIRAVERVLQGENILAKQVAYAPRIFTMDVEVLKERLRMVAQTAIRDFKDNKNFLHYIIFTNQLRGQLNKRTQRHTELYHAVYRRSRLNKPRAETIAEYVSKQFGISPEYVVDKLMNCAYRPHCIPYIEDVVAVCKMLLEEILRRDQLARVPELLLFDLDKIKQAWKQFPKAEYEQEFGPNWQSHPMFGDMLLYEFLSDRKFSPRIETSRRIKSSKRPTCSKDLEDDYLLETDSLLHDLSIESNFSNLDNKF